MIGFGNLIILLPNLFTVRTRWWAWARWWWWRRRRWRWRVRVGRTWTVTFGIFWGITIRLKLGFRVFDFTMIRSHFIDKFPIFFSTLLKFQLFLQQSSSARTRNVFPFTLALVGEVSFFQTLLASEIFSGKRLFFVHDSRHSKQLVV